MSHELAAGHEIQAAKKQHTKKSLFSIQQQCYHASWNPINKNCTHLIVEIKATYTYLYHSTVLSTDKFGLCQDTIWP
jgi:hypothetical protein